MKKTKVKINIGENIKEKIQNIKEKGIRVIDKIKVNLKENKGKSLTKQSVKYYTLLLLMIIVAFVSTYANIKQYQNINTEDYEEYFLETNKNVETNSSNIVTEETLKEDENKGKENTVTYETAISSISINMKEETPEIYPVNGKIVQEFAGDTVIYYESLGLWKTHGGVDISCEKGEKVINVLKGKVVGIYQDEVFGNSVVVEGEKYIAVYSSLDSNILVNIGDKIDERETIGYAGTNAAEETLGVHLHFELMKDGEYINPSIIGIK